MVVDLSALGKIGEDGEPAEREKADLEAETVVRAWEFGLAPAYSAERDMRRKYIASEGVSGGCPESATLDDPEHEVCCWTLC
jgi:hypothetical protein